MRIESPYHEGELAAQRLAGAGDAARRNAAAIGDAIVPGAIPWVARQSLAAVASVGADGAVWPSILVGSPGMLVAPDARRIEVDRVRLARDDLDPLWTNLRVDPRIGLVILEPATRRRLRVNGRMTSLDDARVAIAVDESYPNCPQYIRERTATPRAVASEATPPTFGVALDAKHLRTIANAETLFVATANPAGGLDASHRGGAAGFVRVVDDRTLRIPDYAGNGMFNTLGNLLREPRAGLAFLDFATGATLQLTGTATVDWVATQRAWTFRVNGWRAATLASPIAWTSGDAWPKNPPVVT